MSTPDNRITEWLAGQQDAMLAELEAMVNIDGCSYDKAGVDAVGEQVCAFLTRHGVPVDVLPQQKHGDCLRATVESSEGAGTGNARRNIVLMGHRDTVFPKGEPQRRPFRVENGIAYGPGVADMKAGIVMNMFVLAAFQKFGGAPGPVVGLFTGDEEIGSPEGRPVIETEARAARVVFNSEPGRPTGNVVTGRKGGVFSVLDITGKAAHSGANFEAGISAIEELARKVQALHALTDLKRGITLNVGLVSGGQSVNTVAPSAQAQIDLRYVDPADRDELMAAIHDITARSYVPGTSATLTIRGEFVPLKQNPGTDAVFKLYQQVAGFKTDGEFAGGCADSGFTALMGAPTLCAVGPVGGKAHSPEEYLEVSSLVPRAQAVARAILKLDEAGV
ncbi:M20/M25/M40 family metallo-hydrolase [Pseudoroseomonas wenyumeiae]|uniref:M20 family peptidase n=1 Tax=Teichococcus wenyumeiae TaxID=2478470 RepID=A0A3A9JH72_9PROT|nr:M20 family metallopeptidase [Pseudoroseomonas wenyumeiae]RKK05912.1 M20 family peptidase [Pseudoroseomonas wenyumeiae]RMI25859.1 M20/M25/M40 family metallo-hydrolase [Pseudoroseomonas wenyumeiae]